MRSPNARMQRLMRICVRDFRFTNGFTLEKMAEHLKLLPEDYEALENGEAEFSAVTLTFFFPFYPPMSLTQFCPAFEKKMVVQFHYKPKIDVKP